LLGGLPIGLFVFRRSRVELHDSLKFDCLSGFPGMCSRREARGPAIYSPAA
jgi:hypothetical protein